VETFGAYRLDWLLCRGGMAELYLAHRSGIEGFEKVVALKRILPSITEEASFVEMFLDEARLAARLDHPNIVRIYDLGEIQRQYFIAMEYLPGEDLRDVHHKNKETKEKLPLDLAVYVAHEAAIALDFAHNLADTQGEPLHLVHRDVSPSNIIITYHGSVKLVDFGIAKARTSSVQTVAGAFKGKLPYSSPEQVRSRAVDRRSDVFALGIVLWEMLSGSRLFQRDNYAAIVEAVKRGPIPIPSTLRSDVSPELDRVVMKALERDPDARFQTALEMQNALEDVLTTLGGVQTARQIGVWLERLFGDERANAKKAIAQGQILDAPIPGIMQPISHQRGWTIPPPTGREPRDPGAKTPSDISGPHKGSASSGEVASLVEPKLVESTASKAERRPPGVARAAIATALIASAIGLIAFSWWSAGTENTLPMVRAAQRSAAVTIESDPPGASILVNGEPTGLQTPATLKGLATGEALQIRLEKPGFDAARDEVQVGSQELSVKRLTLKPAVDVGGVPQ
jgi:serine/threonine-protein kinase